jgi:1-deoxy-D-xylulose-5-phosphate synthase
MTHTTSEDIAYLENRLTSKARDVINKIKKDIYPFIHTPSTIFEKLGFKYSGPYDGHDINLLEKILKQAKKRSGAQIIHIKTKKGKGYKPAEENPNIFHGISPYNKLTGKPIKGPSAKMTFPQIACDELITLAKKDKRIVAITPGTPAGTSISKFQEVFPDRFFDVGIAEQHAVTFAAGLARDGIRPVISIYSTFLQRAYDQIVHDVCIQELPVVFLARSGIVEDGETHNGVFDVSYLRHIPNLIVMSPKDDEELRLMIRNAFVLAKPVVILHPKGESVSINKSSQFKVGQGEILTQGKDLALLAFGSMVKPALKVADKLMAYGIKTCVVNTKFAKHIDKSMLDKITQNVKKVITLEEYLIHGGVGSRVLEVLAELDRKDVSLKQIGIEDKFLEHGNPERLKEKYKLDEDSIVEQALKFLGFK